MSFLIDGCVCTGELVATGQLNCMPEPKRDAYKIFLPYYDSTGAINTVAKGTVINEAYILGKFTDADTTKRWYMTPKIENFQAPVPTVETESVGNQTFNTGEEIKVAQTFEHVRKVGNAAMLAFYNQAGCNELGMFSVSRTGQLKGMNDGEGNLIPIKLQDDSLSAQYSEPVAGQSQKVMVSYTVDELENDAFKDFIDADSIAYSALKWFTKQPKELIAYIVAATTTNIVLELSAMIGSVGKKSVQLGFVTADLVSSDDATTGELYNITDGANAAGTLTYDAINEQYTFTYTVPVASADEINLAITKTGYHFKTIKLTTA